MTKKDYELIAHAIRVEQVLTTPETDMNGLVEKQVRFFTTGLADRLAMENPRFDREKFLEACNVTDN